MTFPFRRAERCLLMAAAFATTIPAMSQFEMQDSRTTASLRGIASPGNGVAWASGTGGTVLRTEDGGFVWQGCAMPPGAEALDFRGVQAFDGQTALVMSSGKGDLSRVYKTTDGCRTWKLVFTNPDADGFFDSMQSMARNSFSVLGDPVRGGFAWFNSEDGGEHWRQSDAAGLAADPASQGAFAASNSSMLVKGLALTLFGTGGKAGAFVYERATAITIGGLGTPHASADEKSSWSRTSIPLTSGRPSAGLFSLAADLRSGALVAVGGDYLEVNNAQGTAAFRLPGTSTWVGAIASPHGYRSSVVYDAPSKTWITVGPNGTDVSRDDGRNWVPLRPGAGDAADADKQWNALALPFAVGPHGRIGRLREGVLKPAVR